MTATDLVLPTVDECFEAAARHRYAIVTGSVFNNAVHRTCCPMAALAIDRDPTLADKTLNHSLIVQATGLPPEYIDGVTLGFDAQLSLASDEGTLIGSGYSLGAACRERAIDERYSRKRRR